MKGKYVLNSQKILIAKWTWILVICEGVTWIKQQVSGKHVFHGHVGTKLDALQAVVEVFEIDGHHVF